MIRFSLILFLLAFFARPSFSQNDSARGIDSLAAKKALNKSLYSSPRKASIMSAILPGLGQIYNRKYWKVPIIYAGIGASAYYYYINNGPYNNYRRALREADASANGTAVVDGRSYSTADLITIKTDYRKQRDLGAIGIAVFYLLNIVDANVDAHLKTFDVSDDLSLEIRPWATGTAGRAALGLHFSLNIK